MQVGRQCIETNDADSDAASGNRNPWTGFTGPGLFSRSRGCSRALRSAPRSCGVYRRKPHWVTLGARSRPHTGGVCKASGRLFNGVDRERIDMRADSDLVLRHKRRKDAMLLETWRLICPPEVVTAVAELVAHFGPLQMMHVVPLLHEALCSAYGWGLPIVIFSIGVHASYASLIHTHVFVQLQKRGDTATQVATILRELVGAHGHPASARSGAGGRCWRKECGRAGPEAPGILEPVWLGRLRRRMPRWRVGSGRRSLGVSKIPGDMFGLGSSSSQRHPGSRRVSFLVDTGRLCPPASFASCRAPWRRCRTGTAVQCQGGESAWRPMFCNRGKDAFALVSL